MKREELTKYHQMPVEELQKELQKIERELGTIKLKLSLGKQKNTSLQKYRRHDLAKIKTLITHKNLIK